jgi:hypothetical protein
MSILQSHRVGNPITLARLHDAVCSSDIRAPTHATTRVQINLINRKISQIRSADLRISRCDDGYFLQVQG